jgi:hypothetical protein
MTGLRWQATHNETFPGLPHMNLHDFDWQLFCQLIFHTKGDSNFQVVETYHRPMATATAQAAPNIAFIKYSDETHGRTDGKGCFQAGNNLSGGAFYGEIQNETDCIDAKGRCSFTLAS